jgi:RNA polymerase sigma-70 factor (ECF subfamily)
LSAAAADLADLVAASARGDRAAFRRLYEATSAKLLGIAFRILRDRQIAEDVVQDAFVKIWQNAGSYSPEAGRPMTWLITIVRNRAIDVVRARRESVTQEGDDALERLADTAGRHDAETSLVQADGLARCLGELETTQRDCFLRAYLDGHSREELSQAFAKPVNTIKTWLHRSANALRLCLERA